MFDIILYTLSIALAPFLLVLLIIGKALDRLATLMPPYACVYCLINGLVVLLFKEKEVVIKTAPFEPIVYGCMLLITGVCFFMLMRIQNKVSKKWKK